MPLRNTPTLGAWMTAWLLALCSLLLAFPAAAQPAAAGVLPVPELTGRVIDQTATLSDIQRITLDNKLSAFEKSKGSQVVVLLVPTTAPEDIAAYANRVASTWKIGRKDIGDGLLLVVAKNDRKLRIEVARTLEGAVPDLAAKRVIEQIITPRFKQGDFAGGLDAGVNAIIGLISPEDLPTPAQVAQTKAAEPSLWNVFWSMLPWFAGALFLMTGVLGPVGGVLVAFPAVGSVLAALPTWWITHSELWAHRGALAGVPLGYALMWWLASLDKPTSSVQGTTPATLSTRGWFQDLDFSPKSTGSGKSSSSSFWDSSSSSDSFSSGGGGSFGGGGASGGW